MGNAPSVMLYVPAGDPHKLEKVRGFAGSPVILDLEDAVAISAKKHARSRVAAILSEDWPQGIWVRINSVASGLWHDDLEAVVGPRLGGIVMPKVESEDELQLLDQELNLLEQRRGLQVGGLPVMAAIETSLALSRISAIAMATPRVRCLSFGAGDLSLDLGIDWPLPDGSVSPTLTAAKAQLVITSRATGLRPPHDGAYPNFRDLDGLRREARQARDMGFGTKHAIHPQQVDIIQAIFTPSADQLAWARKVVRAFDASVRDGVANVQVEGRLVDYPVAERARRVLAMTGEGQDP
jgi:citrate lyase subunit beta / citryl-CoA lyase